MADLLAFKIFLDSLALLEFFHAWHSAPHVQLSRSEMRLDSQKGEIICQKGMQTALCAL